MCYIWWLNNRWTIQKTNFCWHRTSISVWHSLMMKTTQCNRDYVNAQVHTNLFFLSRIAHLFIKVESSLNNADTDFFWATWVSSELIGNLKLWKSASALGSCVLMQNSRLSVLSEGARKRVSNPSTMLEFSSARHSGSSFTVTTRVIFASRSCLVFRNYHCQIIKDPCFSVHSTCWVSLQYIR